MRSIDCSLISKTLNHRLNMVCSLIVVLILSASTGWSEIYRVKADANPGGDGLSWSTAFQSIQPAIDAATQDGGGEVWVAGGVYRNTEDYVVEMADHVDLYGGFIGEEIAREERVPIVHTTTIDGQLERGCVRGASAVIDGFTLYNGKRYNGGGMNNIDCSPIVNQCTFLQNESDVIDYVAGHGGGIYNEHSILTVSNTIFLNNHADAIATMGAPPFTPLQITSAGDGGAIHGNNSQITVVNCVFSENEAGHDFWNTGMYFSVSGDGGAIYSQSSTIQVTNCTLRDNAILNLGISGIDGEGGVTTVKNSIIWEDKSPLNCEISYSCIKNGFEGPGNIDSNPRFMDSYSRDYRLQPTSPCIDTATVDGAPGHDIVGTARPQENGFDMGAYEFTYSQSPPTPTPTASPVPSYTPTPSPTPTPTPTPGPNHNDIYRVNAYAGNTGNGSSWQAPFISIQEAIDTAASFGGGEVWVAKGVYTGTGENVVTMRENVHLYGGFAGNEVDRANRNWEENETIVDGELVRRCVFGANNANLHALTLFQGSAHEGGGMHNNNCSSTIADCTFDTCYASYTARCGGYQFTYCEYPLGGLGGGIYNFNSSPSILRCRFHNNHGIKGGAIYNEQSSPFFQNCLMTNNVGVEFSYHYTNMTEHSAAMYNQESSPVFINCTISNNSQQRSSEIHNYMSTPSFINCIINEYVYNQMSELTASYCCSKDHWEGTGNIQKDPLFVDQENGDFRLHYNSPCRDTGSVEQGPANDILDYPRPMWDGTDMGAYEYLGFAHSRTHYLFTQAESNLGWTFTRPDPYTDIDGSFNTETNQWDITVSNNENSFGYLESPLISIVDADSRPDSPNAIAGETGPEHLYQATFLVTSNLDSGETAPVIRLRVSSESFQRSDLTVITSENGGYLSPSRMKRQYTTHFLLPENEKNFRLDVDVLNFYPQDTKLATIQIHNVTVSYVCDTDELEFIRTVETTDFTIEGQSDWWSGGAEPYITQPSTFAVEPGKGLMIRGMEESVAQSERPMAIFGHWTSIPNFSLDNSLTRIRWTVGSDVPPGNESTLPPFRLRVNSHWMRYAYLLNVESTPENNNLPSLGNPVTYESWFFPPEEVHGISCTTSLDYLYLNRPDSHADDPTAALYLQKLEVLTYSLP